MGVTNAWLSGSSSSVAKTGDTMTGNLSWSGTTIAGIRLNNLTTTQAKQEPAPQAKEEPNGHAIQ